MKVEDVIKRLEAKANPENVAGMARFAIETKKAFGLTAPELKQIAKEIKRSKNEDLHSLAAGLWQTGIYDARTIAYLIDDPKKVTVGQMDAWVKDFDNWAICDGACLYLFSRTPFVYDKVFEWAKRDEEFIKRAGIALMAVLAVHDKKAGDESFIQFLPVLSEQSDDDRNFVKKAVSWALRQIGKRNSSLNRKAIETAETIKERNTKAARWIASDVLRELTAETIQARLAKKSTTK